VLLEEEEKAPSEALAKPLPRKESKRERGGTSPLRALQGAHILWGGKGVSPPSWAFSSICLGN